LDEFTVSLWAKAVVADDTTNRYIFNKNLNMYMFRDTAENYLFQFYNDTDQNVGLTALSPKDTNWHHIVVIYNRTDFFSYIDMIKGQLFPASGDTRESSYTFSISSPMPSFYGRIDDFMIYDRALTYSEIQDIHNDQLTGLPSLSLFSRIWEWVKELVV
jgi:hypothetical protein